MEKIKVLGICAGQGALLHPLLKSNRFQVIANVEPRGVFHTPNEEQWKLNFGNIPFIKEIDLSSVEADVIVGSPNCGHSSVLSYSRKKSLGVPEKDKSLNLFISSVSKLKPKCFLMENLPKLLEQYKTVPFEQVFPDYDLKILTHPVSVFGNSQISRKRLVIVGVRSDIKIDINLFEPFKIRELAIYKTLVYGIDESLNFRELPEKKLAMYYWKDKDKKTLTVKEIHKLWAHEFKGMSRWPINTEKMKTLPGIYRILPDSYPYTLRPSNRQFGPKGYPLGLEEFKRIMGFPDNFKMFMDVDNQIYWLNKGRTALSKGSVYEVGLWFGVCLKKALKPSLGHTKLGSKSKAQGSKLKAKR